MTTRACLLAYALAIASCSGTPQTLVSPSGVAPTSSTANPDGSTLKVSAPRDLGPNGVTAGLRPTFSFTNSAGKYAGLGLAYELELLNAGGGMVYNPIIGETPGSSSNTIDRDLSYAETYRWRARARLGNEVGPWSDFASFRTIDPPPPPPPAPTPTPPAGGGGLPFPVPAACNVPGGGNGFPCVAAIAAQSVEWGRCASGSGVGCHRFSRQVVYALSRFDPGWQMIQAAPGGHACNCSSCGPSDGTMFREDTTVYRGGAVFDMIIGAGGPAPGLNWAFVGAPRPGDLPALPPVCQ